MNRRSILALSAAFATGLLLQAVSGAVAQTRSMKDQLIGTWMLVSYERTTADGTKTQTTSPKGILMLDAAGRYAMMDERGDRPKFKSATQPTTEEVAAATLDFFAANFGTWSVNEADKVLTLHFDGALRPNNEGMDANNSMTLAGDELKLTTVNPLATGARIVQAYRRAK
jgi:Lipocalin-like domain